MDPYRYLPIDCIAKLGATAGRVPGCGSQRLCSRHVDDSHESSHTSGNKGYLGPAQRPPTYKWIGGDGNSSIKLKY